MTGPVSQADPDAADVDGDVGALWTPGLPVRRHGADGDLAVFSTRVTAFFQGWVTLSRP